MLPRFNLLSAWNDGKIRAYTPESGKLKYTIHDAHNKGVTAINSTSDCTRIISGGGEGQVRVWNVGLSGGSYKMTGAMKEHKGEFCFTSTLRYQSCYFLDGTVKQ